MRIIHIGTLVPIDSYVTTHNVHVLICISQSGLVAFLVVLRVDCVSHVIIYLHIAVETMPNSVVSITYL